MGNRPFSRKICNFFCKLTAFYPLRHGFAVPDSPFCRYATSSPGRGKSALKGTPLRYAGKFTVTAEAVPLGKVAATSGSRRKGCSLPAASSPSQALPRQIPLFVAARHLPPARGKSFLKGRALGMAEKLTVELQLSFAFTTPPVKMRLERSAERDKREI